MNGIICLFPSAAAQILPGISCFIIIGRRIKAVLRLLRHTDNTGYEIAQAEGVHCRAYAVQMGSGTDPHVDAAVMDSLHHPLHILRHGNAGSEFTAYHAQARRELLRRRPRHQLGGNVFIGGAGTVKQIIDLFPRHSAVPVENPDVIDLLRCRILHMQEKCPHLDRKFLPPGIRTRLPVFFNISFSVLVFSLPVREKTA